MRKGDRAWLTAVGFLAISFFWIAVIPRQTEIQTVVITADPEYIGIPVEVFVEIPVETVVELIPSTEFMSYIGNFTVTAYCSCEKCCGDYALNRPTIGGKEIVFTSIGAIAEQGITVAVDPQVVPYGTKLYIEGVGIRVAQDTGGGVKGSHLDVYYSDHNEAWNSGLNDRARKVWIVNEDVELSK